MSTSVILKIAGINKNIDESDNDEEAETRILHPAATSKQLCREQLQTPADAEGPRLQRRENDRPTSASYPADDRFVVLKWGPSADKNHGLGPDER